ncbi:hypothetical protein H5410_020778 [Solanum commersonii]|uniref:Uncharacterized protein n=1 Tax=Solanum commersonii TaxID=4109 RepID=A0A9J5Z9E8_SOLCO|nr:hypothetical protein H5410_020778 [Solanum commersonii]
MPIDEISLPGKLEELRCLKGLRKGQTTKNLGSFFHKHIHESLNRPNCEGMGETRGAIVSASTIENVVRN